MTFRNRQLTLTLLLVMLVMAFVPVQQAEATVRPYLGAMDFALHRDALIQTLTSGELDFDQSQWYAVDYLNVPVEQKAGSLTQGILNQAAIEYKTYRKVSDEAAMLLVVRYLIQSGVTSELAEILVDDISAGRYEATQSVITALQLLQGQSSSQF